MPKVCRQVAMYSKCGRNVETSCCSKSANKDVLLLHGTTVNVLSGIPYLRFNNLPTAAVFHSTNKNPERWEEGM